MKEKDWILIVIIVCISAAVALLISRWLFSSPGNREQSAEVVDVITDDFPDPPSQYFNVDSVNPTPQLNITGSANPNPFNPNPQ